MGHPYSTQADVQTAAGGAERLRQLSDVDRENAINVSVVSSAVTRADSIIDSYAKKRYAIPLDTVPQSIATMSAQLAVYLMKRDRGMLSQDDIDQHANDVAWLRDLSRGVVVLDLEQDAERSEFVVDRNAARPSAKDVSRSKLKGFW
jgi:phage gp36-like protein